MERCIYRPSCCSQIYNRFEIHCKWHKNVCTLTVWGELAAMVTLSAAAPDWAGPREHYSHLAVLHWDGVSEERKSSAHFRILQTMTRISNQPNNLMEQNPTERSDSRWTGQDILSSLWNATGHYHIHKSPSPCLARSQMNQIHCHVYFVLISLSQQRLISPSGTFHLEF